MSDQSDESPALGNRGPLERIWVEGYSIAELWGFSKPANRGTSAIETDHALMWGILGIVEYQVDEGAGHRYLRERLLSGDWIAIGVAEPKMLDSKLVRVPAFKNAKFGRKASAVGDGITNYADVHIVHSRILDEFEQSR